MKTGKLAIVAMVIFLLYACQSSELPNGLSQDEESAAVTAVTFVGESGSYSFWVTIESPDTGCGQYADWWDVFRPDGTLIYRRILTHSHVDEQPFTRSGGPVNVASDEIVIVRAHMNNLGFGTQVFRGSVDLGLQQSTLGNDVAAELEMTSPLPVDCAF